MIPKWAYFILLLVVAELAANVFAKQFALHGRLSTAAFSILGFIAANVAWLFALRAGVGIGKGFIVAAVLSGIGTVLLGVLVYHEQISGPALIGVVLGIVAIAFLAAG